MLVVNHALYCSHLASESRVLPDHDIVIIDEAHSFPDNATSAFAGDIATDAISRVSGMLARAGADKAAVDALGEAGRRLAAVIDAREGTIDVAADEEAASALVAAAERLATASAKLDRAGNDYAKRTTGLALGRLEVLRRLAAPGPDDVVWVERVGRNRRMRIAPIAAGETIGNTLLACHPVIAVSATLGGEPPFPALARQMGFRSDAAPGAWADPDAVDDGPDDDDRPVARAGRGYVALRTASSFDWRAQGILYVAKDLPDPTRARDDWVEAAGDRICALVNAAGGRALVLCTSRANVTHFAAMLRERTDHYILEQGERDTGRLAEAFIEDESSVLVGTRSFWAGIDAAGAACVLVVIDRIPFPAPGEPVQDAAAHARAVGRPQPLQRDRPAGGRARPRAGNRPAHPHRHGSRCRRGARPAAGDAPVPRAAARGDAAAPAFHRSRRRVRVARGAGGREPSAPADRRPGRAARGGRDRRPSNPRASCARISRAPSRSASATWSPARCATPRSAPAATTPTARPPSSTRAGCRR